MRGAVYSGDRALADIKAGQCEVSIAYVAEHMGWGRVQLVPFGSGYGYGYGYGYGDGYGYGSDDGYGYGDGYGSGYGYGYGVGYGYGSGYGYGYGYGVGYGYGSGDGDGDGYGVGGTIKRCDMEIGKIVMIWTTLGYQTIHVGRIAELGPASVTLDPVVNVRRYNGREGPHRGLGAACNAPSKCEIDPVTRYQTWLGVGVHVNDAGEAWEEVIK